MNLKLLTEFKELLLNELYPIGKTEIFYDSNDHSNYLGFNWERTALDRFIKGYSPSVNTIASTGGEKTHTLTVDEIPSHNHSYNDGLKLIVPKQEGGPYAVVDYILKTGQVLQTLNTGGSQAHNNEPQYQVFAIWRRVS